MASSLFSRNVLILTAVGFVAFAAYGFLVHGILLASTYEGLGEGMWRTEAEMNALTHWIMIAYALMAWMLAVLRPANIDTLAEGVGRGVFIGVFLGSVNLINYAVQPVPLNTTLIVFAADVAMVAFGFGLMAMVAGRLSD